MPVGPAVHPHLHIVERAHQFPVKPHRPKGTEGDHQGDGGGFLPRGREAVHSHGKGDRNQRAKHPHARSDHAKVRHPVAPFVNREREMSAHGRESYGTEDSAAPWCADDADERQQ